MKVLVVNCGSSSLKYQLIDMENEKVLCKGKCDVIGGSMDAITPPFIEYKGRSGAYGIDFSLNNFITSSVTSVLFLKKGPALTTLCPIAEISFKSEITPSSLSSIYFTTALNAAT